MEVAVSISGMHPNDPDPDSDIEPTPEEVDEAQSVYFRAYQPHEARALCALVRERIKAFCARYKQVLPPSEGELLNPIRALDALERFEKMIDELRWTGKLSFV